ncbi:MAG: hypothetical protein LBC09_07710 [Helicobacteraceae bacterium]|jgi:hypothetical protein|nr:hypothetical protein [Helicobacteraceae bacterium]
MPLCAFAVSEIGVSGARVYYDKNGRSEEFWRLALFGGYQFNSQSDQLSLTLISDKEIDEAQFGYAFVMPSLRDYAPFDGYPYIKGAIGFGNAHAKTNTLTEISYGGAIGFYATSQSGFRARFEASYFNREWQIDRKGKEEAIKPRSWRDDELAFSLSFGFVF